MDFNGQTKVCNHPKEVKKHISFLLGKNINDVTAEDKIILGVRIRYDFLATVNTSNRGIYIYRETSLHLLFYK